MLFLNRAQKASHLPFSVHVVCLGCHAVRMHYYVYIMSNRSKTLYTGVTNDLDRRVWEHRNGLGGYFTSKYKLDRLVHYEVFSEVTHAITREKQIKGWLRIKKMQLIVASNLHAIPGEKHRSFARR